MTAKTLLAADPALLSEAQWSSLVAEVARLSGWRSYHTFDSRRSNQGFPDWVFVKDGRLIFAELKSEVGQMKPQQVEWREALLEVEASTKGMVQHWVWRPSDYDHVVEILTGRRPQVRAA